MTLRAAFGTLISALLLSACVTINIYFPAAQAKEAADRIVEDILQAAPAPAPAYQGSSLPASRPLAWMGRLLDLLVPPAHAAQPDFAVDSPAIRKAQASLKARLPALAPYFAQGAVGLARDGRVAPRDPAAVPLRERGRVNDLVQQDNADRDRLYQAIAQANGHPEWEPDIRSVFARTWIEKAEPGWWYQNAAGSWVRK